MVSAAAQTVAFPYKRSDYDKRIQDTLLTLLLRRINEAKDSSSLLLKYQQFRESISENKNHSINQLIDHFNRELSKTTVSTNNHVPSKSETPLGKKNSYVNSVHFQRLFPQADILFEDNEYGMAAREILRENISGEHKTDMAFLPTSTFFKKQSYFNGILLETYSDHSFDGLKGIKLDFYY